jgi:hypothetical protein
MRTLKLNNNNNSYKPIEIYPEYDLRAASAMPVIIRRQREMNIASAHERNQRAECE